MGSPNFAGSATTNYTLTGSNNFFGTADYGHFYWQVLTGDGSLVARVASMTVNSGTMNNSAKAGVMIRQSLSSNSPNAMMALSGGFGGYFQVRSTAGGTTSSSGTGGTTTVPTWIKISRSGNSLSGYISSDGVTWTQVGSTTTLTWTGNVYLGFAVSSNTTTNVLQATFDNVQATAPGGLSNVWTSQDIGTPNFAGSGSTGFTLVGSNNFYSTSDYGQFNWLPLDGDGTLVARVSSMTVLSGTMNSSAKAGVMIRQSLDPASANIMMAMSGGFGGYFQVRSTSGGSTSNTNYGTTTTLPYWIKVVRSGTAFSGYVSPDGSTWIQVGSTTTLNWGSKAYIGLAASSNTTTNALSAVFDNVAFTPTNSLGNGSGLSAEYFSATDFTTSRQFTRVDPAINFTWTGSSPGTSISSTNYSVRWTGTITPRYSESYTFSVSADSAVNVWIGGVLVINGTTSGTATLTAATPQSIVVQYAHATGSSAYVSLSWSSASQGSEVIPQEQLAPWTSGRGRIMAEYWLGLSGSTVASLTGSAGYPKSPTGRTYLNTFDILPAYGTSYGTKVSGYICPPQSGNYVFFIAGTNTAELWLSTDDTPGSAVKIATVPAATNHEEWTKYTTGAYTGSAGQESASVALVAGQRYYIHALHKQDTAAGADSLSVGWLTPSDLSGGATVPTQAIPGQYLAPYEIVVAQPTSGHALDYLATGHPRLMTNDAGFVALADQIAVSGSQLNTWYTTLKTKADSLVSTTPTPHENDGGTIDAGDASGASYLNATRQVLDRVSTLAFAYRIEKALGHTTNAANYLGRACNELDCACGATVGGVAGWPDWNPGHWLDVGEMTAAIAIGYDWLYDGLTSTQQSNYATKIDTWGLQLGQSAFGEGNRTIQGWTTDLFNWNAVCNGGMILGALAVGDVKATDAQDILYRSIQSTYSSGSLAEHGPDGSSAEGANYWYYAMRYLVFAQAGLETAGGGTAGLAAVPGQAKAGGFVIDNSGGPFIDPTYSHYNGGNQYYRPFGFNDAGDGVELTGSPYPDWSDYGGSFLFWNSWRYDQSAGAWWERNNPHQAYWDYQFPPGTGGDTFPGVDVFNFIWYDSRGGDPNQQGRPVDAWYRHHDLTMFRSDWLDTSGFDAGLRAGSNDAPTSGDLHNHLEAGSFSIDALGVRWGKPIGSDSYGAAGYFDVFDSDSPNRWQYYRCRAEGGNNLVINPGSTDPINGTYPDQDPNAPVSVIKFASNGSTKNTVFNLTPAYLASGARQVWRGFRYDPSTTYGLHGIAVVQDEIHLNATSPAGTTPEIYWFMHTTQYMSPYQITVSGSTATLTDKDGSGRRLWLNIVSPAGSSFTIMNANPLTAGQTTSGNASPHPTQQDNSLVSQKLAVHLTGQTDVTLMVEMVPLANGESAPTSYPTVTALKNW